MRHPDGGSAVIFASIRIYRLVQVADKQASGGNGSNGYGGTGTTTPVLVAAWIRSGCPPDSKPVPFYQSVKEWNADMLDQDELSDEDEDEDELSHEDADEDELSYDDEDEDELPTI